MRVLIAGGGTGGHLYPGIALAEEVTARPGGQVLFVGTARGLEARVVPAAGYPLELLDVSGIKRAGLLGLVKALLRLPRAFLASLAILRHFRPDMVVGVGGYASGPIVLAAALSGRPTAIQEQNSVPGITNRILGRFVRAVFVAFDDARLFFDGRKVRATGNPVRRKFLEGAAGREPAASPVLLVCGGSQGARAVNDAVLAALPSLLARFLGLRVLHQAGPADFDRVRQAVAAARLDARVDVRAFIDDMASAYRGSTLVIGRAGALTLAELAITGRPAVLIPLPTAADDHQTRNAAAFERAGAAALLPQAEATGERLAEVCTGLLADEARRTSMSAAMAGLGRPAAARRIVDALEAIAAGSLPPDVPA